MSFKVKTITFGKDDINAEPVGELNQTGWLPGTFVKFSNEEVKFSPGALVTIEKCDNRDWAVGFLCNGTMELTGNFDYSFPNDNEPKGFWTKDESKNFMDIDGYAGLQLDSNKQLSKMGTGIVNVMLNDTGVHKFYVYEKYDKEYRDSDGISGGEIDWSKRKGYPCLYVSNRGLITYEKEHVDSQPITFVVGAQGKDDDGEYLLIVSG